MYTLIDSYNTIYRFDDCRKLVEHIQQIYIDDDICMSEILASIEVQGLSIEAQAELYMELRNWTGDSISMIDEEGNFVL